MILTLALAMPLTQAAADDERSDECVAGIARLERVQARELAGELTRAVADATNSALEACGEPRAFLVTIDPSTDAKGYLDIPGGPETPASGCTGTMISKENTISMSFADQSLPGIREGGIGWVTRTKVDGEVTHEYDGQGVVLGMSAWETTDSWGQRVSADGEIRILTQTYDAYVSYLDVYCKSGAPCAVQTLLTYRGADVIQSIYALGEFNECKPVVR